MELHSLLHPQSPPPPLSALSPHDSDAASSHEYVALLDEAPFPPPRASPNVLPSQRSTEPPSPSPTPPLPPSSPSSEERSLYLNVGAPPAAASPESPAALPDAAPPQCRICLEEDDSAPLIVPCLCRGTAQFVHRSCLDTWRLVNRKRAGFHTCQTCGFTYATTAPRSDAQLDRMQRRYRLRVVRDVTGLLLLMQAWLVGLAALISVLDQLMGEHLTGAFPDSAPRWLIAYLFSSIFTLAFIGLLGEMAALCGWDGNLQQRDGHPVRADLEELCRTCGFSGCDCSDGGGADDCGPAMIICLVFVLVFALFAVLGIVYGIWYASQLVLNILGRHVKRGWYRVEVERHPVKDWTGQEEELRLHAANPTELFSAPTPPPREDGHAHI